jgi:hypothetical protein
MNHGVKLANVARLEVLYVMAGVLTPWVLVALLGVPMAEPETSAEDAYAEKVVTSAGLSSDSTSLLEFLKKRTLSEADRAHMAALVRRLGDGSYAVRSQASADLIAAGANAVSFLKPALADPDVEIARRAERCLESIQRGPGPMVPAAAARLLGSRRPAGAVNVLLAYIPFADDESVEEAVLSALVALGLRNGKADPLFVTALESPDPARRAAAAFVVAQSTDAGQRREVMRLLADPVLKVRFQAASTLFTSGDKAAVPVLMALLTDGPPEIAWQVEELLCRLTDTGAPTAYLDAGSDESRRKCRLAWEAWWKMNEGRFDPVRARLGPRLLGLTVIADLDRGTIREIDPNHKERWKVTGFRGPVDVQVLPNGNILVAENHGRRVAERDRLGHLVWEKITTTLPASCQRLPNGNTLIATYNQILEVTSTGKEVLNLPRPEGIYWANKQRSGHIILLTSTGKVVTLDATGKESKSFDTGGVISWSSLDVLPNGHVLACCPPGKVVEFDGLGRRVWECAVPNAVCARRLPNGNTLVCASEAHRVIELDRSGKEVWSEHTDGRPWHVLRR